MPVEKRAPRADDKDIKAAAAQVDGAPVAPGPAAQQAPAPRPKTSYITVYFFLASFVFRSLLMPLYTTLNTTGIIGRKSMPSAYMAPGVTCTREAMDGPKFCEHELIFEEQGIALLSCDPGRGEWNTVMGPLLSPDPKGKLWLYDYAGTKTSRELELVGFPSSSDFHPLGIDSFTDISKTTLFVINHQRTGPSIELFSLSLEKGMATDSVTYERTIPADPLIKSANGMVALDHEHLYVTNDHAWTRLEQGDRWAVAETTLGTFHGKAWITYIDFSGSSPIMTRVFGGIPFANGITRGSDGTLYVASSVGGSIGVLQPLNASTPLLGKIDEYVVGYALDNIHMTIDPNTNQEVIIAAGPAVVPALNKLARDPHSGNNKSPSWISMIKRRNADEAEAASSERVKVTGHYEPNHDKAWDARTVYQDDGHHFSSATGAGVDAHRNLLIAPGLYETGILVCRGIF